MSEKICGSCGIPMKEESDFGGGNIENKYCKYCTYEDGELKDFETKLKEMTRFVKMQGNYTQEEAEQIAKENMAKMHTWKKYF